MSASALHKLKQARERLQSGDAAGAQLLCEQVLARAPRNPEALCLLAIAQLHYGHPDAAIPLFERSLAAAPRDGVALEHLGLAHLMVAQFAEAEHVLRRAVSLPGAPPSVSMRLGAAILHQGRAAEAAAELARALARAPDDIDCHMNLGRARADLGDSAGARSHFEAVLHLSPGHADALFNLGVLSLQQDAQEAAREWFERALAAMPQHTEALVNLGIVFEQQQRLEDAESCFRRALATTPGFVPARSNLARVLALQGRYEQARECYLAALQLATDRVELHEGLAAACMALGRFREACTHWREVVRLEPAYALGWSELAGALFQLGELDEARPAADRALTLDPDAAGTYHTLALIHLVHRELDRVIAVLEAGYQRTGADSLLGMLNHQLRHACNWTRWREVWPEIARRLEHSADLGSPFWLLGEAVDAQQQLSYARRWSTARFATHAAAAPRVAAARAGGRVRVGYLSCDLHAHAAAYLLAGVFEQHDRRQFEVFAYSYGPEDHSPVRARIRQACEHFSDVAWDPDDVVVRRIRDDALDILVDLKGYTLGARTAILAQRPCPIQVNWMGYPGTMGADFIDCIIADDYVVPAGQETTCSERVLRLTHCWQSNDRARPCAEPLTRPGYGLPERAFVFCCFAQAVKITPEIFTRWLNLLNRVPGSVLWLGDDNRQATRNLQEAAEAGGVAAERLVFAPRAPFAEYLARYRVANLALDTFPYTSHSTASDALWSGCPLVALSGATFAARVSGSILTHAGVPELITHGLDAYEALAYRIATESGLLEIMRTRVAAAQASSLFDAASFARDLERLYLDLARRTRN